jgi:hypothetical protein
MPAPGYETQWKKRTTFSSSSSIICFRPVSVQGWDFTKIFLIELSCDTLQSAIRVEGQGALPTDDDTDVLLRTETALKG